MTKRGPTYFGFDARTDDTETVLGSFQAPSWIRYSGYVYRLFFSCVKAVSRASIPSVRRDGCGLCAALVHYQTKRASTGVSSARPFRFAGLVLAFSPGGAI